jgi:hypothetical protein
MSQSIIEAVTTPHPDRKAWQNAVTRAATELCTMPDDAVDQLMEDLIALQGQLSPAGSEAGGWLEMEQFCQSLQTVVAELIHREVLIRKADAPAAHAAAESTASDSTQVVGVSAWSPNRIGAIAQLYHRSPTTEDARNHLLHLLAFSHQSEAVQVWSDLLCDDPPEYRPGIALAFEPLMQPGYAPEGQVLTKLLHHATAYPQIAPAVFDLFNYFYRSERLENHPAAVRCEELTGLLGGLASQMANVESGNFPEGLQPNQVNQLVSDSVAMIVSLCDLFALLNYQPAIERLHQVLALKHRRVQTEAASALARLGDERGRETLIGLANQPVARLRVLAYAEELGIAKDISLELQGEIALAESHLAVWLSEPKQMGLAPSDLELLDNREFNWPSYEHPVQCYLFRFSYGLGDQAYQNVGICGPMTHAFGPDISNLSIDDMYAAFAGWQTVHSEIFQMTPAQAENNFPNDHRRLTSILNGEGAEEVEVQSAGSFFGEITLLATAKVEGETGTFIIDGNEAHWIGAGNPKAPIDWSLAYAIWRGRQLLANFNSPDRAV